LSTILSNYSLFIAKKYIYSIHIQVNIMTNVYRILMLMIASITALNITVAQTSIPRTLSIQGVLTSSFGSTPLKGKQVFRVGIYESPLGGLPLHEQIDTVLVGETGLYQFSLGGMTGLPRTVKFDKPYFIDISVNGEKQNMRIPLQSAAYAFMAGAVENEAIGVEQLSPIVREKIFPEDKKGGEKALANYPNGFRTIIAGGDENRTNANYSSILGGFTNSVSGAYGSIVGGQANQVQGNWAFVGGGQDNRAQASWSTVSGGNANTVTSAASGGTIGGGQNNQLGGIQGTIGGGQSNLVTSQAGTVAGGQNNRSLQIYATIVGGNNNQASGPSTFVGGGNSNTAITQNAVIVGGVSNTASGLTSFIGSGTRNVASGAMSAVMAGQDNISSGTGSTVGGGNNNRSSNIYTTVSGGTNNDATAQYTTVAGGINNDVFGDFGTIAGGINNFISSTARFSTVSGGQANRVNSMSSTISGGTANDISSNSRLSFIGGGDTNIITHTGSSTSIYSVIDGGNRNRVIDANYGSIGGGRYNTVTSSNNSIIAGGAQNTITTSSDFSTIGGGQSSTITSSDYAAITGGSSNTITSSNYSSISGGISNAISSATHAFIGSGNTNTIGTNSTASFIGSGEINDIGTGASQSVIVGGYDNDIANGGVRSAIVGGISNDIADADWAFVGGGNNNDINANANYSTIVGGEANVVNSTSTWSVIGGGRSNSIGSTNTYSFIGGGQENTTASNDDYSTIVGGYSNGITGDRSTIVGGYNNSISGTHTFVGGGFNNQGVGDYNTISGGRENIISFATAPQYASIMGGRSNTIEADYGTASGQGNIVRGTHGIAMGNANGTSSSATYAVALGNGNSVTGSQGVAIGSGNTAAANALALGNGANAVANQMVADYDAGFIFRGEGTGTGSEKFTAQFINDGGVGENGILIQVNNGTPNNSNDFIRFTDGAGLTVGRIEGQTQASKTPSSTATASNEWANSDQFIRELELYNYILDAAEGDRDAATRDFAIGITKTVLGAVETGISWADVGARFACGSSLFTLNCLALGGSGIAEAIAKVATVAQMVLDVVQYSMTFAEARQGVIDAEALKRDWACNRFAARGVTYESGSADYAEWLPKSKFTESFIASDIVGIKDGKISKNTIDADHCMVISTKPIVLGNTPEAGKEKEYEKVAFMGQVPVRVLGKVELGDYILPSGKNNGLGIARKPKDLSPYEYRKVVGVAWSAGDSPAGINIINVAVGLNHKTTAQVIEEQTDKIVLIEKELDEAQAEIKNINDALVTLVPSYKEVRKLESNGTLIEMFKGLDFDKPKVVSARKLKSFERESVSSDQSDIIPPDVKVVPIEEIERGYLEARQKFIDAGGDPESDPFYSRMERDPKYREIMLKNINRMLNKSAVEAQTKNQPNK
jgi:hypothetical protein